MHVLEELFCNRQIDPKIAKNDKLKINEDIEKCRIRTQAYLRRLHCRHNIIEDFGEVIMRAYDRFLHARKRNQRTHPSRRTE